MVPAMDHDTEDTVCAARDLTARLQGEHDSTRRALRAAELQLAQLTDLVLEGAVDYPVRLVRQIAHGRRQLAAIESVLADLGHGARDVACA